MAGLEDRIARVTAAAASDFDAIAGVILDEVLDLAARELAASEWSEHGRLLRAMIHFRPGDAYTRLVVREHEQVELPERDLAPSIIPCATAWRWVSAKRCAVTVDVNLGMVGFLSGDASQTMAARQERFDSRESQGRLLERDATHLFVLPLNGPAKRIEGMVSIEADCQRALGSPFVWPAMARPAQALLDVAAPWLCLLPQRRVAVSSSDPLLPVVGRAMSGVTPILRTFARQEETVLLSGPTGVGKSRLATWCHAQSPRRDGPFETVDLATVPEELQMGTLFGWRKGSFTGASRDTLGAVGRADGGTLFIDEIDKLSLRAQAGLLRVLEERRYRPLGEDSNDREADVRFIVGTNARLHALVKEGRFREDLLYRINVLPVAIPTLAERSDEIGPWAALMLARRHEQAHPNGAATFDEAALGLLAESPWPGNLRQLDNIVRRAYALALIDLGPTAPAVVVRRDDVRRAIALEGGDDGAPQFVEALRVAAIAFLDEAERRGDKGLDLGLADALRGLILAYGIGRLGSKEQVFRVVGRSSVVQSRNQTKTLRSELRRIVELHRAFDQPLTPALEELVGHLDDGGDE